MNRYTLVSALALCSVFLPNAILLADDAPTKKPSIATTPLTRPTTADACFADIRAFATEMGKQGYWMDGSDYDYGYGYGYGYPMGIYGYGYGAGLGGGYYGAARPGYSVRTLLASAAILGHSGNNAECENVLAATRTAYDHYVTELRDAGYTPKNPPDIRQRQIATAQPVHGMADTFRSDQLLDAVVVNPGNGSLGSVHDLVMNPETGKIAYVIVARGGLFGIDASYTPVPWNDFKASPNASLLLLDATKDVMAAAPRGKDESFTKAGGFGAESRTVDAYWAAHVKSTTAVE
jgi:sporulation protein YlmC with PRC-barrel domain